MNLSFYMENVRINNPILALNENKDFKINSNEKKEDLFIKKRKRSWKRVLNKKFSKIRTGISINKNKRAAENLINKDSTNNKNKLSFKKNSTKFEIRKSKQEFDPTVNYYIEYWKMFNENEYILAKIKENLYEINNMKGHLQELKAFNKDIN